jgi:hypothetical protein
VVCRIRLSPLVDGEAATRGVIVFMEADPA